MKVSDLQEAILRIGYVEHHKVIRPSFGMERVEYQLTETFAKELHNSLFNTMPKVKKGYGGKKK